MSKEPGGPAESLGRAIQLRRVEMGMKRRELAIEAGLSYPYVSEIENGQKEPSAKALRQLAEALGLSLSDLASLTDRLGSESPSSSLLLDADSPRIPDSARTPPQADVDASDEGLVDAGAGEVSTPSPLVSSGRDGMLERWISEAVPGVVRRELTRWAETELPRIVRDEIEAAMRRGGEDG